MIKWVHVPAFYVDIYIEVINTYLMLESPATL